MSAEYVVGRHIYEIELTDQDTEDDIRELLEYIAAIEQIEEVQQCL